MWSSVLGGFKLKRDPEKYLFSARVTRELFPGEKLQEQFTAFQPAAVVPGALNKRLETEDAQKDQECVGR